MHVHIVWLILSVVAAVVITVIAMTHIQQETLTKEEYMRASNLLLNEYGRDMEKVQGWLDELQKYALGTEDDYHFLSPEVKVAIGRVLSDVKF
jgi:hypothetical protein